jgi:hypothetical protein
MEDLAVKKKCFFVVSRYNEDVSWLKNYTNKHIIYNKGNDDLKEYNSIRVDNIGANQYDICSYIYDNYDNLPDTIAFVQGNPYDHCVKEKFDKIISNNWFAPLESYEHLKESNAHKKCEFIDWGYMEINNSWYISAHNQHIAKKGFKVRCPYNSFDDFMTSFFYDYKHIHWLRFAPGAQYLVEKERCLQYSRTFWSNLMHIFPHDKLINGGTEAHIIERALWLIFSGFFRPRDKPKISFKLFVGRHVNQSVRRHVGQLLPKWFKDSIR